MPDKQKHEPTSAEIEAQRHVIVAEAIGEPEPVAERPEPKPDKRDAIQIERDEQKRVEKAVHNITLSEPKA